MKIFISLILLLGFNCIISCGPSEPSPEEKVLQEVKAKAKMDSLFNAAGENMISDSVISSIDSAITH